VSLLEPAVAALIAVIVLGEHLPPIGWLGLGLLFASLVITATNTRPTTTSHRGNRPTGAPNRAVAVATKVNADVEPA
jgi:DME family drug/metabolite transporter